MSEEQLSALLAKLKDDERLRASLADATSVDQAVSLANEAGFLISKADLMRNQAKAVLELTDEELEGVAGGKEDRATAKSAGCAYNTAMFGCFESLNVCC